MNKRQVKCCIRGLENLTFTGIPSKKGINNAIEMLRTKPEKNFKIGNSKWGIEYHPKKLSILEIYDSAEESIFLLNYTKRFKKIFLPQILKFIQETGLCSDL